MPLALKRFDNIITFVPERRIVWRGHRKSEAERGADAHRRNGAPSRGTFRLAVSRSPCIPRCWSCASRSGQIDHNGRAPSLRDAGYVRECWNQGSSWPSGTGSISTSRGEDLQQYPRGNHLQMPVWIASDQAGRGTQVLGVALSPNYRLWKVRTYLVLSMPPAVLLHRPYVRQLRRAQGAKSISSRGEPAV